MSHFEKVSFEQWKADCGIKGLSDEMLRKWYDAIKLPKQATAASAGCDFFMPFNLNFEGGSSFKIATGVRWVCEEGTVGVIDADYCDSDNEGHIIISLINPSDVAVPLEECKPFAQGIVVKYEVPDGAESEEARNGGFGSTDR